MNSPINPTRNNPRIRYYDDQLLKAEDLQADVQYETWMRELHVRGVHKTWGVALGYEVKLDVQQRIVQIGPGLAYDVQGREIVSSQPVFLRLPDLPKPLPPAEAADPQWCIDLLISHQTLPELVGDRDLTSSCLSATNPLQDQPIWHWSFAGESLPNRPSPPLAEDVRKGEELPLARFQINAASVSGPDLSLRRQTQGLIRPYLVSKSIAQGSNPIQGSLLNWSMQVYTGGFTESQSSLNKIFYFVNLMDHPLSANSGFTAPLKAALGETAFADLQKTCLGPFVSIENSTPYSFTLRVRMARSITPERLQNQTKLLLPPSGGVLPVPVNWMGLELVEGCPPPPLPNYQFFPSLFNAAIFVSSLLR
jgi:hypothetical protein